VLALLAAEVLVCVAIAVTGAAETAEAHRAGRRAPSSSGSIEPIDLPGLVAHLRLTDLALVSDAGYCRHPTQADRFAPFSDHPGALEHLPAGSLVPPPERAEFGPESRETSAPRTGRRPP
jgi:hypothetical protein